MATGVGGPGGKTVDSQGIFEAVAPKTAMFTRQGNIKNAYLKVGEVVSDTTGYPIQLDNAEITFMSVTTSAVSTYDIEIFEWDGSTETLLDTINVTSSRNGSETPVTPISVTTGNELRAKVNNTGFANGSRCTRILIRGVRNMSVIVKNESGVEKTYAGIVIADGAQHTILSGEQHLFAMDETLLTDVGNADAVINDGSADLGISDGLDHLKGVFPAEMSIRGELNVPKEVCDEQAFTVTTELITIDSNSEKDTMLLKNPSDSGKKICLTHFKFGTDSASVRSIFRIYKNPTITTDGTALTVASTYVKSSPASSEMELYKLPTISDRGQILNIDIAPSNSPSKGLNRFYWVDPGNDILVTVDNSVSNAKTFSDIYWIERDDCL